MPIDYLLSGPLKEEVTAMDASCYEGILHAEAGESREVSIRGPELPDAALAAEGHEAGILHLGSGDAPCPQAFLERAPGGGGLGEEDEARRLEPGLDLLPAPRRRPVAWGGCRSAGASRWRKTRAGKARGWPRETGFRRARGGAGKPAHASRNPYLKSLTPWLR